MGSFWSNYARPGIESIGSVSRYLMPTSLPQYAQTFPTVQKFTSLPRETQNLYLGVVAPLAALAAYKAAQHGYKCAQNLYQWWNKPTEQQLKLMAGEIIKLGKEAQELPIDDPKKMEKAVAAAQLEAEYNTINKKWNNSKQQQGWFSSIPRPSFSLPSWQPSWLSWPTWRSSEKATR